MTTDINFSPSISWPKVLTGDRVRYQLQTLTNFLVSMTIITFTRRNFYLIPIVFPSSCTDPRSHFHEIAKQGLAPQCFKTSVRLAVPHLKLFHCQHTVACWWPYKSKVFCVAITIFLEVSSRYALGSFLQPISLIVCPSWLQSTAHLQKMKLSWARNHIWHRHYFLQQLSNDMPEQQLNWPTRNGLLHFVGRIKKFHSALR